MLFCLPISITKKPINFWFSSLEKWRSSKTVLSAYTGHVDSALRYGIVLWGNEKLIITLLSTSWQIFDIKTDKCILPPQLAIL